MFSQSLLKASLTKEQKDFGLRLEEYEDFLFLMYGGKCEGKFSSHGATIEAIRKEADQVMNEAKSGIEFAKQCPACGADIKAWEETMRQKHICGKEGIYYIRLSIG